MVQLHDVIIHYSHYQSFITIRSYFNKLNFTFAPKLHVSIRKTADLVLKNNPLLVFLFLLSHAFAQREGQFIDGSQRIETPFTITVYSTKQGLPQSQVIDIQSKNDGSLLLATANGIVEYDGFDFTDFITDKSYKNSVPKKLLWDEPSGNLFMLDHSGGLYLISPSNQFISQCADAFCYKKFIYTIDGNGNLYQTAAEKPLPKLLKKTGIRGTQSLFIHQNKAYIATDKSVYVIDLKTGSHIHVKADTGIYGFSESSFNGKLYAFSRQQVYEIREQNLHTVFSIDDNPEASITDLVFISDVDYYVSTSNGLYFVAPEYTDFYNETDLPSHYLISLHYNVNEDCLFVGTGEKGLLKLQHKNCYSYALNKEFKLASLGSVITTNGGTLVAGSSGKIFHIGLGNVTDYWKYPTNFASLAYYDGNVLAGTWGNGLFVLRNKQLIYSLQQPQLPDNNVHGVFRDSRKVYWVATHNGIARGNDFKTIHPFLTKSIKGRIICFYELRNGSICIGGGEGVYVVDRYGNLKTHIGKKEGIKGKEVRSFYEDSENKLWIGTYNGGLYCYENKRLTSINSLHNCELYSDVFTLAKDQYGYLNITSNQGLWKVSEKDLNDFYHGKLDRLVPFNFGQETGILNTEFNGGFQNNFLHTSYDHFYFPTIEGVVINMPESFPFKRLHPKIKQIWVNDTIHTGKSGVFKRSTHTIQIDFSCPRFNNKYNTYYQYKLIGNGMPNTWSRLSKQRSVAFKMLPPGNYTLQFRAVDSFNDRHPAMVKYSFEILPFFYETLWFKVSIAFTLFLIALALGRWRFVHLRNKERHANAITNTILELKLKAIQAKMNPHFIFNALNNIQYLIVLRKLEAAENALTDFSQLLRKFLYQSDKNFITIEEEFDMLRLYLSIEKFRFNNPLTCTFHTDEELSKYYIPSMLFQPLVENAIKHGLLHSEKEHILTITATRHQGGIRIMIEDNGIGRAASKVINRDRNNHISHGFRLVQEKIKIVREKYGIIVRFELVDLQEPLKTGTLVIVDLPVITDLPAE